MSIEVMPDQLANQIAAGEVVERPASVVKELVENAIDAGASQIDIAVEESGLKLIRVTDNGQGIPYDEVKDAFERHATSKLLNPEDLFRIRTLGFRGEALPSIASVSELTIDTAQEGQKGKRLHLSGGKVVDEQTASARPGTRVQVEDLFFNTPARLKYVKTLKTELSHITNTINRFALAHPDIAFKLVSDGMTLTRTTGNKDLRQTIAGIYGVEAGRKMVAIQAEDFDFKVEGYVSSPDLTRSNRSYMTVIVNGRYIKNYAISNAIVKGYGSKLMVGRFPIAVIHVTMDPLLLDVNVHPTKEQIRISNEGALGDLISSAIKEKMDSQVRIPNAFENIDINKKKAHKEPNYNQEKLWDSPANQSQSSSQVQEDRPEDSWLSQSDFPQPDESVAPSQKNDDRSFDQEPPARNYFGQSQDNHSQERSIHGHDSHVDPVNLAKSRVKQLDPEDDFSQNQSFPELDYIGQMHGTYLFAQNEDGLYIVDQHAAQERIKYEYYREEIGTVGTVQQSLLVPIVLEYPTSDYLEIKENLDQLEAVGIELEDFGTNTFIVKNHPSWFISGQEESTIKEMVDFLLDHKKINLSEFREATAIMMSCKRSIKANHYLSDAEARALLEELKTCQNPYNCPHGRPVLVSVTNRDIEKMFKRIQDR